LAARLDLPQKRLARLAAIDRAQKSVYLNGREEMAGTRIALQRLLDNQSQAVESFARAMHLLKNRSDGPSKSSH